MDPWWRGLPNLWSDNPGGDRYIRWLQHAADQFRFPCQRTQNGITHMREENSPIPPPAEEWDFSEANLPDKVELCFRHEYRREFYLSRGVTGESVIAFLRIPHANRTGSKIYPVHCSARRQLFLHADANAGDPFHENPWFRSGAVVSADVLAIGRLLDAAYSDERKAKVVDYLGRNDKQVNVPPFFYQALQPAETEDGFVVSLLLNTKDYGKQELIRGFKRLLDELPGEPEGNRGPATSRYRKALKNLAIVRIRQRLSLHAAIHFFRGNYLAGEFLDKGGHSFLEEAIAGPSAKVRDENKERVIERIRERRRQVLECFREENPEAAETDKPACYEEYSGI